MTTDKLIHLVTRGNLERAIRDGVEVPARCGQTRDFRVLPPAEGHDRYGSRPQQMCPECLRVSDELWRRRNADQFTTR
ncbi:hypothetical protein D092_24320 [Rhodococcus ruber Chol-4]|uniref:hypothetical protein n=1 Tax=Rhodococcus ruber TaxID=1830 RepID=UPI00035ECAEE|nr:hypothetical protein [Rhodococcus ruber]KXF83674.1 hypothetical protein D092_24320 [Rhodococcus ruber Chol-4]